MRWVSRLTRSFNSFCTCWTTLQCHYITALHLNHKQLLKDFMLIGVLKISKKIQLFLNSWQNSCKYLLRSSFIVQSVVDNELAWPTHLAYSNKGIFIQKIYFIYPQKTYFSNEKLFHTRLKEPIFYPKENFLYLPEKITNFLSKKISYTCLKKLNFLSKNNLL